MVTMLNTFCSVFTNVNIDDRPSLEREAFLTGLATGVGLTEALKQGVRNYMYTHKYVPVHWRWTISLMFMLRFVGTKSYSTAGNVCTIFPRFPLTCTACNVPPLKMSSFFCRMETCVRSWKVRPNWAVLMANFIPCPMAPISRVGFCVIKSPGL